MTNFVFLLPLWLLALLLTVSLIGFALMSRWAAQRWVLPHLKISGDGALFYGAAILQSAMVLYGLVAALTAVSVWSTHSQVGRVVSNEATEIAVLWRDLSGYPQPQRDSLREVLREYTRQIIEEAWPKQREGHTPTEGVEIMNRLQAQLFGFEPSTEGQKLLHGQTLSAYNDMIKARRQRLDSVAGELPTVMWVVLIPGAIGCILLSLILHVEDTRFQTILVVALSGFIAMVLFVIIALDHPFQGQMAIPADAYQLIYEQLMIEK